MNYILRSRNGFFAFIFFVICLFAFKPTLKADEGMWLLPYLEDLIMEDMEELGLELSADQIYAVNNSSLKDAVVIFGSGCTGEIISPEGLLLTNHHCGVDLFQALSNTETDYLEEGFWAMSQEEELQVPGLSVSFLVRVEDVTDRVLSASSGDMDDEERSRAIRQERSRIQQEVSEEGPYRGSVELFRVGDVGQYLLFVYQDYADVRLVGAPPNSIGQFGGDEDNWEWPNHNADFALFRVYMQSDGQPSESFNEQNIPYEPAHYFPVALTGLDEGDFVMAMGYPGITSRYLTSYEIEEEMEVGNKIRADIRGKRQEIWKEAMEEDDEVRLQYASRYFNSSNYWKYSIGQNEALRNLEVIDDARKLEDRFRQWVREDPEREESYGEALTLIEHSINERRERAYSHQLIMEALIGSQCYFPYGRRIHTLYSRLIDDEYDRHDLDSRVQRLREALDRFYDYHMPTERAVLEELLPYVMQELPEEHQPDYFRVIEEEFDGSTDNFIAYLFETSVMTDRERIEDFLRNPDAERLKNDPGFHFTNSVFDKAVELRQQNTAITRRFLIPGKRLWYEALNDMIAERELYPDANFTMRLTYGGVKGYESRDAVIYEPFTTHEGIIEKVARHPDLYSPPDEHIELLTSGDFGPYGVDGILPVSFLSNLDITGGNSGSPVLNSRGELVGIAYDGNWEAMSSDIAYSPDFQRAISVDIRYVLFMIDKYAGAGYLLEEMDIIGVN
ncbi:MAG: S46 family peptidase [Bacteroidales bacterium]